MLGGEVMSEQCIDDLAIALRDQLILVDDLRDQLEESKANHENAVAHMQVVCAERDQLKLDNARWRKNYEHLIVQHMPRTGDGCEKGWSRVVEARELQAEVDQLKAENAELLQDAARYRWLREGKNTEWPSMVSVYATAELDAVLDRAMSNQQ